MPNIEAQPEWANVREIGIELARGGPDGNMNEQAKALVARTELLKEEKANKTDIVQGQYRFATLALFNEKKATIPVNSTVIIDEAGENQGANTWDGTTLKKSAYDPLTLTKAEIQQNLLFDPFNETVGADKRDLMQSVFGANCDNYLTTSPNSPFNKPTLQGLGANSVRRHIDVKKLGVKAGDKIYIRMMAYSVNSSIIQFGAYLRKSDSSNIDSSLSSKGGATLLDTIVGPLTITADTHHILILINGSADKELIASSISTSPVPKYVYGSINADYYNESSNNNLLFDPFSETVEPTLKTDLQSVRNAQFNNYLTTSPNSPFGKPTLEGTGNIEVRRYIDVKKLGVKVGDKIYIRMAAYFTATGGVLRAYCRDSADNVIAGSTVEKSINTSGYVDIKFNSITVPTNTHHILVLAASNSTKELIALSISKDINPEFNYGTQQASYYLENNKNIRNLQDMVSKNSSDVNNLMPDPFFRSYKNGVTLIDGFPLLNEAGYSVVDYANSPFIAKNAIRSPVPTSGSFNKNVLFAKLGVKVGDTITVKLGLIAIDAGAFGLGVYARKFDNTVIGSATNSNTILVPNTYTEVAHTITVTQEMMDSAYIIQIRLNVVGTTFTNGYHVLGGAIYKNNTTMNIQDTNYVEDDLRKGIAEAKSANLGIPFTFGNYYLREVRQRTRKRLLNESAWLVVASIGDSWTHNRGRWSGTVANQLITQFGDGGGGWTGFGFANAALPNDNARTTYTVAREGSWQSHYGSSVSPDICDAYSTTAGDRINCRAPATPQVSACQLFYIGSGDGVIRYRMTAGTWSDIESVAWTTLNLNAVAVGELGISELSGIPTGQVSLQFEVVSGTCTLCGINWKSNTDGVVWHKIAGTGTNTGQWTGVNGVQWAKGLQALNPNLVTILHGTNDQNGRSATAFATNIGTLIDRIRSVLPLSDILVIMPCENGRNNSIPMSSYTEAAYNICKSKKVAFMDLQKVFGENFSEYSSTSARNWFNADLIHPEPNTGGRAITDAVMRLLLN